MTKPERPYEPQHEQNEQDRQEQERTVVAQQGESQVRDSGSATAQNTPGPEAQSEN